MAHRIAFASQSGNVAKTTLAYATCVEATKNGLNVEGCDLDVEHQSLLKLCTDRVELGLIPEISVTEAKNAVSALKGGQGADIYVIDCPSRATEATKKIAEGVDILIQPTSTSRKDLDLAITTFYDLVDAGIPTEKLLFVITRNSTEARLKTAKEYLRKAEINGKRFNVLSSALWEKTGYEVAMNDGFSVVETTFETLNTASRAVVHEILTQCLRHD